ncbi:hypothetical protein FRC12_011255 [Ceratobasidium sp. 428]|nr:hypothetical protein FRC12_011255 [Ceratobasidium sp. 428]
MAAALNLEDYQLHHSNYERWDDDWYQLRHDEANLGAEMITQLGHTLKLGAYTMADQGDSLKYFLDRVDWDSVRSRNDVKETLDPTCLLAQILDSSPPPADLHHVLILRLQHSHWMLIHFRLDDHVINTQITLNWSIP